MFDILRFLFFLLDGLLILIIFFSESSFHECIHRHRALEKLRKFRKSCFEGASVPRPFTIHTSRVLSDAVKGRFDGCYFKDGRVEIRGVGTPPGDPSGACEGPHTGPLWLCVLVALEDVSGRSPLVCVRDAGPWTWGSQAPPQHPFPDMNLAQGQVRLQHSILVGR